MVGIIEPTYEYKYTQPHPSMTFVYTGKGKRSAQKDSDPAEQRLCAKQACAIQWCLAKRNHKEHFCQAYIDDWKNCCEKVRAVEAAKLKKNGVDG